MKNLRLHCIFTICTQHGVCLLSLPDCPIFQEQVPMYLYLLNANSYPDRKYNQAWNVTRSYVYLAPYTRSVGYSSLDILSDVQLIKHVNVTVYRVADAIVVPQATHNVSIFGRYRHIFIPNASTSDLPGVMCGAWINDLGGRANRTLYHPHHSVLPNVTVTG